MKSILKYITVAALGLGTLTSCDAIFDNLEGDLTKMQAEDMFRNEAGIKRVLANLYNNIPMGAFDDNDKRTFFANDSRAAASYSASVGSFWNYSQMRSINLFMDNVKAAAAAGTISQETAYNRRNLPQLSRIIPDSDGVHSHRRSAQHRGTGPRNRCHYGGDSQSHESAC